MKKKDSKPVGLWNQITAGFTMVLTAFFLFYAWLLATASDWLYDPVLALVDMLFLLAGMIYFLLLRFLPVRKFWRNLLITAVALNFLLIFAGCVLLLTSAS